ncbi:MAG: hypothetical protein ACREP0_03530 [Rhodanobacteraceae bacterium]
MASSTGSSGAGGAGGGSSSTGGAGGAAGAGGNGMGGDATAGAGGAGGAGGSNSVNAGTFDMSNSMNGTAVSAAGITTMAQNSGAASLIQQGVTVQANLTVSH